MMRSMSTRLWALLALTLAGIVVVSALSQFYAIYLPARVFLLF